MNRDEHALREDLLAHAQRYSPPLVAWVGTWAEAIEQVVAGHAQRKVRCPGGDHLSAGRLVEVFDLEHFITIS